MYGEIESNWKGKGGKGEDKGTSKDRERKENGKGGDMQKRNRGIKEKRESEWRNNEERGGGKELICMGERGKV